MRLESAQGLKQQMLQNVIVPFTTTEAFAVGARLARPHAQRLR